MIFGRWISVCHDLPLNIAVLLRTRSRTGRYGARRCYPGLYEQHYRSSTCCMFPEWWVAGGPAAVSGGGRRQAIGRVPTSRAEPAAPVACTGHHPRSGGALTKVSVAGGTAAFHPPARPRGTGRPRPAASGAAPAPARPPGGPRRDTDGGAAPTPCLLLVPVQLAGGLFSAAVH